MKKLALSTVVVLAFLASSASAGTIPTHNSTGVLVVTQGSSVESARTARPIPGPANTRVDVSFNGKPASVCWADSVRQLECAWHGVLAVVTAQRGRGPASLRVVSTRADRVRVFARFSW